MEPGSGAPRSPKSSLDIIAARARPSDPSSLHPWTSQSNLLCYHPNRMISLRLDGYAWSHHSHGRMRMVTLGRPVLPRTTLQKESGQSLMCFALPTSGRAYIPKYVGLDPETQNRNTTLLRTRNLLGCSLTTMRSSWCVDCCIILVFGMQDS